MVHSQLSDSAEGRRLIEAIREACATLPEAEESVDGFGHTTFKVRKKSFLIAGMGEDGLALSFKSDPASQALLVQRGPFYRTPYIGQHGWVSIADPLSHPWDELQELIADAYRLAAPKSLVKQLPAV